MYGLEEGQIDPRARRGPGGVYDVTYGGGDNLPAKIYDRPVLVPYDSEQAEEAVFVTKPYIRIQMPPIHDTKGGDLIDVPLTEKHKMEYPQAWHAYRTGSDEMVSGTPLSSWMTPLLDPAKRIQLAALGVHTIEQVRDMSESGIGALGQHGRWLKKSADDELRRRREDQEKLAAGSQVEELREQNRLLLERFAALEAKFSPGASTTTKKGKKGVKVEPATPAPLPTTGVVEAGDSPDELRP